MVYDENRLRMETLAYWANPSPGKLKEAYIPRLLRQELAFARARPGAIADATCDLLVLLVGYSMEPLLQAVCVFQPQQIVLVLNQTYDSEGDGSIVGDRVKELICLLPEELINRPKSADQRRCYHPSDLQAYETTDQPAAVFGLLQTHLKAHVAQRKQIIIDITGAKKSMVAGAFLYAAYTGTPISYVDFGRYAPQFGRPYGYTCRIDLLRDPYEAFRLRDWERVRQLYQHCQFRTAREILQGWTDSAGHVHPGLIAWMGQEAEGERYFTKAQVQAVECLAAVLTVYELWDNGDFHQACKASGALPPLHETFPPPLAVRALGPFWPHADTQASPQQAARQLLRGLEHIETGEHALPETPHHFALYARDEIAKIDRLIRFNEDYRSALLRAIGLGESLLKARWVCLWLSSQVEVARAEDGPYYLMQNAPPEIQSWQEELKQALWKAFSAPQLIPGLRYADSNHEYRDKASRFECKRSAGKPSERQCFYMRRALSAPWISEEFIFGRFRELCNKAIHTYLSVPKSVAEEALRIAQASLADYEDQWATRLDAAVADKVGTTSDYEPLPWEKLCAVCGIDFLPPAPAAKEAP